MDPKSIRPRSGPEKIIRDAIFDFLMLREWYVIKTHGNEFQSGLPDLYATHYKHGPRWIEVKLPDMKGSKFTNAQYEVFPKLLSHGTRIWLLTAATEIEYKKLFLPCNLWTYMNH